MEPLPCPFCGSPAHHTVGDASTRMNDMVTCCGVDCCLTAEGTHEPGSALRAWNRRASPASAPEVTDGMALAFHHALTDGAIGQSEVDEIKTGLRAALTAAPTPPVSEDRKDAERWQWITREGRTRELRIPATENKASIDAAIDGAIKKAVMQEDKP